MIVCRYEDMEHYLGIAPNLDRAIRFLLGEDPASLADREIDGRDVFLMRQTPALSPETERKWEKHFLYADIQIALTDNEVMGWLPEENGIAWEEPQGDTALSASPVPAETIAMRRGTCVFFLPGEPHKPNIGAGSCEKLVIKVRI